MNVAQVIARKRDGETLSDAEIGEIVARYASGELPDYQMSALAMAIYIRGMTTAETSALTRHMLQSGDVFEWPQDGGVRVDKHSTGGIGDKVSLILAPLLAAAEMQVPMISGRGLGATGGTLDKLEAIPGFRTDLSMTEMRRVVAEVGCVISGATANLVPADRKLYALRDVTATVPSIPLITASIMSKKLAEQLDALVLDVKCGSGAFMKSLPDARELAESLVATGRSMGVATTAQITEMSQPLGRMAGNAVEVNESLAVLAGAGPSDVRELTLSLGGDLLVSTNRAASLDEAIQRLATLLDGGQAMERFEKMVACQGGRLQAPLEVANASVVASEQEGYVNAIDTEALGVAVIALGGGRRKMGDPINPAVGLEALVRLGEEVSRGTPLARIYAASEGAREVKGSVQDAFEIGETRNDVPPLVYSRVDSP